MHQLRSRGVTVAQICTHPFEKLGKTQARVYGIPDLAFVMIPHPLGGLTLEAVEGRADAAMEPLLAMLRSRST